MQFCCCDCDVWAILSDFLFSLEYFIQHHLLWSFRQCQLFWPRHSHHICHPSIPWLHHPLKILRAAQPGDVDRNRVPRHPAQQDWRHHDGCHFWIHQPSRRAGEGAGHGWGVSSQYQLWERRLQRRAGSTNCGGIISLNQDQNVKCKWPLRIVLACIRYGT